MNKPKVVIRDDVVLTNGEYGIWLGKGAEDVLIETCTFIGPPRNVWARLRQALWLFIWELCEHKGPTKAAIGIDAETE